MLTLLINTSVQHHFHHQCLQQAKFVKPECPLCRCSLTPDIDTIKLRTAYENNAQTQEIIHAAARVRQALRFIELTISFRSFLYFLIFPLLIFQRCCKSYQRQSFIADIENTDIGLKTSMHLLIFYYVDHQKEKDFFKLNN